MYIEMYIFSMSRRYSIAEARERLSRIVDQAESGVEIELTRRGRPVAVVISIGEFRHLQGERVRFGEAYRRFLDGHPLAEVGLEDDFLDGLRDRGAGRKVRL